MMRPRLLLDAAIALAVLALAWQAVQWGLVRAVFQPDPQACQALQHTGACWGVVAAKWPVLLFGHFPYESQWRAGTATALLLAGGGAWAAALLAARPTAARLRLVSGLALVGAAVALLLGGWGGLSPVSPTQWGGLPLTLVLALLAWLLAWPIGVALAYGRWAGAPPLAWGCTTVIELVRGAPLVIWLFAAAFAWPALLPESWTPGLLLRVLIVLGCFAAAYLAEILRGGLQTVPAEQAEAARVLGLGWWGIQRRIVLPQAVRATLPPLVSHAIGLLKDTSLVMVIGLHELSGSLGLAIGGDAEWRPFYLEAYITVAAAYAILCLAIARLGRRLEAAQRPVSV